MVAQQTDRRSRVSQWFQGFRYVSLGLLIGCLGSGCSSTPYQRDDTEGGYVESKISEDIYRVTFRGNKHTLRRKIENYLGYRCAELTIEQGYDSFAFTERIIITAGGELVYATWSNAQRQRQYRVIPVGGLDGLFFQLAMGAVLGSGQRRPSGLDSSEPMGGGAQATIQMFNQLDGEIPQSPDFSDDVVYDARGVMKFLQQYEPGLSLTERNNLRDDEKTY